MREERRNNNFGTLHLLAAFFVMYGHQCVLLSLPSPTILGSQIHALGVKIIFLLSGYLITKSILQETGNIRKNSLVFLIKRLGRIYPELIFCILGTALIIGPIFTQVNVFEYFQSPEFWTYILNNIRLMPQYNLPGVFGDNPYVGAVNGSLWTMPVEVFMYFGLFVVLSVSRLFKNKKIFIGIVTLLLTGLFLVRVAFYPTARIVFYGTDWVSALNIIPYILIGGVVYVFNIKRIFNTQIAAVIFLAANAISFNTQVLYELLCILVLPYFVFSLVLSDKQYLKLRWLKGEYAYGIYLWGFVIQQSLIQWLNVRRNMMYTTNRLFIFSAIFTYFFALISYEFVYAPISKKISKFVMYIRQEV